MISEAGAGSAAVPGRRSGNPPPRRGSSQRSMPASTACWSISASSSSPNSRRSSAPTFSSSCATRLAPMTRLVHPLVAKRPREGELRERLPATFGDRGERAEAFEPSRPVSMPTVERPVGGGARVGRDPPSRYLPVSMPCASGVNPDHSEPELAGGVEESLGLDPAVQHGVRRLVDQQRRTEPGEHAGDLAARLGAVRRDADVARPTRAHDVVQRAGGLLERGCRGRDGGSRRGRRRRAPVARASGRATRAGACDCRRLRTAPATCPSRPSSR